MNDSLLTFLLSAVIILGTLVPYVLHVRKKEAHARKRLKDLQVAGLQEAHTMHPHIDVTHCIGCGACVTACPEGDVLGVIDGKATLIHGAQCVGHGLCAEACPVGAIELLMANPGRSAELPLLSEVLETSVPHVYIVGELGGLGLIRNAIEQGKRAIAAIAQHRLEGKAEVDVAIVGAGPAGLGAGLTAKEMGLSYALLEQGDIGGAILHYPRGKVVMSSPVQLPLWGKLMLRDVEKEKLLKVWSDIIERTGLEVRTNTKVLDIQRTDGMMTLTTSTGTVTARSVVLALGRRGSPRKLGVPGEEQGKVMYRLIDTSTYSNNTILVVGGGDSAIEAAMGLAIQPGNVVTLSYRKGEFTRIKQRNRQHLDDLVARKKVRVMFESEVKEIFPDRVAITTKEGEAVLPNDFVFIFAGGELPFELLKRIGIAMQTQVVE